MFKLKQLGPNRAEVHVGHNIIFFSYETPVAAFWINSPFNTAWICTKEQYSRTTSKHLNQWLGGNNNVEVLSSSQFQTALAKIWAPPTEET